MDSRKKYQKVNKSSLPCYGRGFYCSEHIELAKEWSCNESVDGFANKYELDTSGLKILNLSSEEYTILH